VRALIFILLCTAASAIAQKEIGDVDEELARRHFAAAQQHYAAHRYGEAIKEFQTARKFKPLPAFDYNIGRCHELLEQWDEAADAYERYLGLSPNAADLVSIRDRIRVLRERARASAPPEPMPPSTEPMKGIGLKSEAPKRPLVKQAWFWGTVAGAVVVVGLAVGLGVGLGIPHDPSATYGRVFGD